MIVPSAQKISPLLLQYNEGHLVKAALHLGKPQFSTFNHANQFFYNSLSFCHFNLSSCLFYLLTCAVLNAGLPACFYRRYIHYSAQGIISAQKKFVSKKSLISPKYLGEISSILPPREWWRSHKARKSLFNTIIHIFTLYAILIPYELIRTVYQFLAICFHSAL